MSDRKSILVGWKKDPWDKRDRIVAPKAVLPPEADLSEYLPEVRDQGQVGSCVGFGIGGNLGAMAKVRGLFREWFSPTWIYNGARFLEGTLGQDVGCYPRSALEWLRAKGGLLESLWPYDPSRLDKRTPPSSLEPEAAKWPVLGYSRVVGGADGIMAALSDGKLVSIGTPWYDEWMTTDREGRLREVTENTSPAGGHETLVYGYVQADGKAWLKVQNSWGTDWGKAGRCLMPASAFSVFTKHGGYDAYVVDVEWVDGPGPDPEPVDPVTKKIAWWLIAAFVVALGVIALLVVR